MFKLSRMVNVSPVKDPENFKDFILLTHNSKLTTLHKGQFEPLPKTKLRGKRADHFEPINPRNVPWYQGKVPRYSDRAIWLPSAEIDCEDSDKWDKKWTLYRTPLVAWHVLQGYIENCWVPASVAALVHVRPEFVQQMVTGPEKINGLNVYTVKLYLDGRAYNVAVSDVFPCSPDKKLLYGQSRGMQLYVSLIEKAFAFLLGKYDSLRGGGYASEALCAFTGYPSRRIDLDDEAWAAMVEHRANKYPMVANSGGKSLEQFTEVGLYNEHSYAVLDLLELPVKGGTTVKLIRLHDPGSQATWNGPYRDGSSDWDEDARTRLEGNDMQANKSQLGTFWMPYEAFKEYFESVDVCYFLDKYTEFRYTTTIPRSGQDSYYHHVYHLKIGEDGTQVKITAYQDSHRGSISRLVPELSFGVALYRVVDCGVKLCGELVQYSGYLNEQYQSCDTELSTGNYFIMLFGFDKWPLPVGVLTEDCFDMNTPNDHYVLSVHLNSKRTSIRAWGANISLQGEALYELIRSQGTESWRNEHLSTFMLSIKNGGWSGMVYAVENRHPSKYLKFFWQFQMDEATRALPISLNLNSSRGSFNTEDTIPPRSWQIIVILVPFNPHKKHPIIKCKTKPYHLGERAAPQEGHIPELGRNISIHAPRKITY